MNHTRGNNRRAQEARRRADGMANATRGRARTFKDRSKEDSGYCDTCGEDCDSWTCDFCIEEMSRAARRHRPNR